MSKSHLIAICATFAASTLALSSVAQAQPAAPPPPPAAAPPPAAMDPYAGHQGLMIGFGLGLSVATCGDCDGSETAFGFDFNVGGFLNPRLALMYDVSSWIDSQDELTLTLAANVVAVQYWVTPVVWVKAGLGLSQARFSFDGESDSEFGIGGTAAAGFEVLKSGSFALDLSGRINILDFDGITFQTFNATVGARWK